MGTHEGRGPVEVGVWYDMEPLTPARKRQLREERLSSMKLRAVRGSRRHVRGMPKGLWKGNTKSQEGDWGYCQS